MKTKLLFLLITCLLFSCKSDDDQEGNTASVILEENDFIIFGNVSGFCSGDCRSLYLLGADGLREDTNENEGTDAFIETLFKDEVLSNEKFQIAKELLNIPDIVLENNFEESDLLNIISDTDHYLLGQIGSSIFELKFDIADENAPQEFIDYIEKIRDVVAQMQ